MKNLFVLILIQVITLSGCAFHIKYHQGDFGIGNPLPNVNTNKEICVFYDKEAYISLDVRRSIKFSNLAFDYGDAIEKISKKYFQSTEKIKFINVNSESANSSECDYRVYPKIEKVIYTYPYEHDHTELNITMSFKIEDVARSINYMWDYQSGTLIVPWTRVSEYILISNKSTYWMYEQINQVLGKINNMEKK